MGNFQDVCEEISRYDEMLASLGGNYQGNY